MTTHAKQPDEFDAMRTVFETLKPFPKDEQNRLIRWVQEKLGLSSETTAATPATLSTPEITSSASTRTHSHGHLRTDIKTFMDAKSPTSDNQFAAAVAYYYKFEAPTDQRKDAINKDDLVDACRKVHRKRPATPAQVLVNALHQGLLDKAERGQYRINSVGENLVAMVLPNQDGAAPKWPAKKKTAKKAKRPRK